MSYHQRIRPEEEEEWLPRRRRPKIPDEPKPRLNIPSRFPDLPDGRKGLGFATLSHSNLKSWVQVAKAQGHNTRTIEAPNVRQGAPEPIELLSEMEGSYNDRIKAVLRAHGVPERIRKGGVIATEDVYGTSPEYWNQEGSWQDKPVEQIINDPVVQAAIRLARQKHGPTLISCSLHVDEESPHIHVVAVPLVYREHAKRGRKPKNCDLDAKGKAIDLRPKVGKWTLDASSLRGQSRQLEANHDEWAAECAPLQLVRGSKGSEMTEEQRRARRNSQTGRASLAEKTARERRESLEAEARADHEVVRQVKDQFERVLGLADDDARAAREARLAAEEAEAAAKDVQRNADAALQAAHADQLRWADQLKLLHAEQVAAEKEKKAAKAEKERALEAQSKAESSIFKADQAKSLSLSLNARLEKLRLKLHSQEANLKDRQEKLDLAESRQGTFCALLIELLDPGADRLIPVMTAGEFRIRGHLEDNEKDAINHCPNELLSVARSLAKLAIEAREQSLKAEGMMAELATRSEVLEREIRNARDSTAKAEGLFEKAKMFEAAWQSIPQGERSPAVEQTLRKAQDLSLDDLPPGFKLPGAGFGR